MSQQELVGEGNPAPESTNKTPAGAEQKGMERVTEGVPIRILTVDDHPLFREGLASVINDQPDMRVIAEASSGAEAIESYQTHRPDVTLLDLRLPDANGIDVLTKIQKQFPEARVVILTTFDGDVEIGRALGAGARGYLLKSMLPSDLTKVIRRVHAGKKYVPSDVARYIAEHLGEESLTERELDVLKHVAGGNRNQDIASKLFIAEETVKVHMKHIMEKLGASDRTQAVAIAVRRGFIQL